jgi:hypothetical protein
MWLGIVCCKAELKFICLDPLFFSITFIVLKNLRFCSNARAFASLYLIITRAFASLYVIITRAFASLYLIITRAKFPSPPLANSP